MKKDADATTEKAAGKGGETPVNVWFLVTEHAALIGDAHHAAGKRMVLPKPTAEEAAAQGLGRIDGVA